MEASKIATLSSLSEDDWGRLENTDSFDITKGDWGTVEYHSNAGARDWKSLKTRLEQGQAVDAPVIFKKGETLHLVSGNTRLMVTRALGMVPKVLVVEL
jgi:hypothetical protein